MPTPELFHAGCGADRRYRRRRSALGGCEVGAIRCRGFNRGVAQLGSALRSGRRGRGFESRHPDLKSLAAGNAPGTFPPSVSLSPLAIKAGQRFSGHVEETWSPQRHPLKAPVEFRRNLLLGRSTWSDLFGVGDDDDLTDEGVFHGGVEEKVGDVCARG
jgi:hypothetical protein